MPPGFTLIELLVVVAVVGVLASLLLPALSKAKASALSTECRGNLREIGLALRMYVDESEHYPMSDGTAIIGWDAFGFLVMSEWKKTLLPYVGLSAGDGNFLSKPAILRKLRCPQLIAEPEGAHRKGQYALNARGTATPKSSANLGIGGYLEDKQLRPTAETRVLAPADMIAVGDVPAATSSSMYDVCSTNVSRWPGNSHGGQANLLFCDGHVESGRQAGWVADSARRRWNNDHEPHPETWGRP